MIREREFADLTWWYASYAYPDEEAAVKAWQRLQRIAARTGGKMNVGCYRHGSSVSGPVLVSVVGHVKQGVKGADQVLRADPCFDEELPEEWVDALIARRIRMLARFTDAGTTQGSYTITRDEPTTMHPDGRIEGEDV